MTRTYDALNRLVKMVDGIGTTTYSYSAAGQLLTEDGPFASDTVTNTYVNRRRVALSLQQPSALWTNGFAYDAAGRLTNTASPAGSFTNIYIGGVGGASGYSSRLTQKLYLGNRSVITNSFDSVARLLGTYLRTSSGGLPNKHEYLYDPAGERTNETRIDSSTVAYAYDRIGQLTVAADSVASQSRGYFYDPAWNLNRRTNSLEVDTFAPDTKNELTNAVINSDFGNHDYTFDANGNRSTLNVDYFSSTTTYCYDDENRLVTWINSTGTLLGCSDQPQGANDLMTQFLYDGFGRLRQRTECTNANDGSGWTVALQVEYLYDGWRVIQERDGNNNPTTSYTRGNDLSGTLQGAGGIGGLLARSTGNGTTWTSHAYYHADGNGNVTYMLDGSQSMAAQYLNDPYGNTISSSGSLADANVYRLSSKEIHTNSGLYYYGYRFYDPSMQRWLNGDPLGEFGFETTRSHMKSFSADIDWPNSYSFCLNGPEDYRDALGLEIDRGGYKSCVSDCVKGFDNRECAILKGAAWFGKMSGAIAGGGAGILGGIVGGPVNGILLGGGVGLGLGVGNFLIIGAAGTAANGAGWALCADMCSHKYLDPDQNPGYP